MTRLLRTGALAAALALASLSVSCTGRRESQLEGPSAKAPQQKGGRLGPVFSPAEEREPAILSVRTPVPSVRATAFSSPSRPPRVTGNLGIPLDRRWKYIVIHHSGTDTGSEASFDDYHRNHNGWRGIGYDFVIGNGRGSPDGLVEVTFRWEQQTTGAHAGAEEYNRYGIGICLVGNFDRGVPTPAQMEALVGLVNYLQERCSIPTYHIYGHRHVRPEATHCPGGNFPWFDLLSHLRH